MGAENSWILTDLERWVWCESFRVGPEDLGLSADLPWSIRKHTLRAGVSAGVDLIEVDNGAFSFSVLPTRGMGIWRGTYRGLPIGWNAPIRGPVHPQHVGLTERGGLGWLAGFDEMIVRCGLDSTGAPGVDVVPNNMGVPTETPQTLHGRIANLPASRVEVRVVPSDPPELVIVGEIHEAALFCPHYRLVSTVSTRCGSDSFSIVDEVTNLNATAAEMELLYHCNFGAPFLEEGARLEAPARLVAPRDPRAVEGIDTYDTYQGPTPGFVEQAYWWNLLANEDGSTLTMLRNAAADKGVVLRFNTRELPAFSQWKNTAAEGDGYVTGLEPGTDFPNVKAFERRQGRVVDMEPGATYRAAVSLSVCDTADGVAVAAAEIAGIQQQAERIVHREPQAEYTPPA